MNRIGTCSLCGGDVMGYTGAWFATVPPPPPECSSCGAIPQYASDVIQMVPRPRPRVFVSGTININCPSCGNFPCSRTGTGCPPSVLPDYTVGWGSGSAGSFGGMLVQ